MRPILLISALALLGLAPAFASAQSYGDQASLVDYWYRTYLGRPADSGITYWLNHLQQEPPDAVLAGILASDEYYKKGGNTPEGFVATLFNDVLRRRPTGPELNFWVRRMYTQSRQDVADELLIQNPGVWVGANVAVQPPVTTFPPVVTVPPPVTTVPGVVIDPRWRWERDRHEDWDHHHDIHDYRRPSIPYYHR